QLVIQPGLMNAITDAAIKLGVVLVGQIHSHGKLYGTDLSYVDRTFGIRVPYYLSLVAPDYAQRPATKLTECGVHVFELSNGLRCVSTMEVIEGVEIVAADDVPVLTVEGK